MDKNYSLNLPDWGPYNKLYLGAAHIADKKKGLRFDLNLFPGYFRRSVMSVRDLADSGLKIMDASSKLTKFSYRYELEWKDKLYIDADFSSNNNVLTINCNIVNNTEKAESISLNAVMSMKCCTQYHKSIVPDEVRVQNGIWLDALDYSDIKISQKVASDGLYLGESRESGFVGGSFISRELFGKCGDSLKYNLSGAEFDKITFRYKGGGKIKFFLDTKVYETELPYTEKISLYTVSVPNEKYSSLEIYPENAKIDFDGFVLGGEAEFESIAKYFNHTYEQTEDGVKLNFCGKEYTVKTDCEYFVVRKLLTDDAYQILTSFIHNHGSLSLGERGHQYTDLFIRPIFVEANSTKTFTITVTAPEGDCFESENSTTDPICNPSGEKYCFSQKIMRATTLSNVVWPIYSRRSYILHNTPGRNWDSLYTWDSGFTGLGLLSLDVNRAKDCLNAYLTPAGDIHSPYVFHGTPLPIQIFLYAEIFYKTGDINFLREYFPLIKQQYRFFADMRKKPDANKTGFFALWDIFYNSGGWDDYPTQKYVHDNNLENEVCPVINTAVTVLCAKILKNLAEILLLPTEEFTEDIEFYSSKVNTYAWDEESGYYGYVKNDGTILKVGGINADMGMDGVSPYIAGISDNYRSQRIIENVKNGMYTPVGVSVVDTRAPYFRLDGYWNGSVWMPHQWILWKGLLDNGETDFAFKIAETALNLWESETSYTYNCYEHFMIANSRGAGFHQFSGLSTPVLMWFETYYKPFSVTSGFMTAISNKKITENGLEFDVKSTAKKPSIIICLPENEKWAITAKGKVSSSNGIYTILYENPAEDKITVTKA